jgi:uncharacterized protein (DUF2249 family)
MTQPFKELDVRPILRNGGEPFQVIMSAVNSLTPGEGLKLFATFRPQPLFSVMASHGFDHEVIELDGGDFEVRFTPKNQEVVLSADAVAPESWDDPLIEIDVTELEPPEPMVRILTELERLKPGQVLFALLSREPLFLFPELTKRGHQWAGSFDETGSLFRIMIRAGGSAQ